MKSYLKQYLVVLFLIGIPVLFMGETYTSTGDLNWSDPAAWTPTGGPPATGDNVIIKHSITLDIDVSDIEDLTITTDGSDHGRLNISGTTYSFSIKGSALINSTSESGSGFQLVNTVITIGDGIEDALLIQGGASSIENCTINVSGYMHHTDGRLTVSNSSIFNVSTAGVRNDGNYNYHIGPNALFKFANAPSATVNIKNGNTTTSEVYIEQATSGYADEFEFNFEPTNVDGDNSYELVSNYGFKSITLNLGTPTSGTNTFYLKPIATGEFTSLTYNDITVNSGSFSLDRLLVAQVENNFNNPSTDNIINDGYLYVMGELSQGSNMVGDGTIVATTYTNNGFSVFGIPTPLDGEKYSSATWKGSTNPNWNIASNWWQGSVPSANTSVLIKSTNTPPTMEDQGPSYLSAVLEIESGGSLTVAQGLIYNVGFHCILSGGTMNVNGADVNINTDLDIQSGGALNITNGGNVKLGSD